MPRKTFAQQAHDYLPPELAAQLPAPYTTEGQGDDATRDRWLAIARGESPVE